MMGNMSSMKNLAETLAENLPTRDDLVNAIGLASRRSTTSDFASVIGVFGAGLLIGAGLALLFAPKSGEEMRRDLSDRMSSLREDETSSTRQSAYGVSPASAGL